MVAQVPKSARKQFVAGASYADEVDLRFRNSCGSCENLRASALPAISRASAATSAVSPRSANTDIVSPCRRALWAAEALPAIVRGPVLACALARLARTCRTLVTLRFAPSRALLRGSRTPPPRSPRLPDAALERGLRVAVPPHGARHYGALRRLRSCGRCGRSHRF